MIQPPHKRNPPVVSLTGVLQCPNCDEQHLHHEAVDVYFRDREDGPGLLSRTTRGRNGTVPASAGEIPGRRDAIRIYFSCEMCDGRKTLLIIQHKGCTSMWWEVE